MPRFTILVVLAVLLAGCGAAPAPSAAPASPTSPPTAVAAAPTTAPTEVASTASPATQEVPVAQQYSSPPKMTIDPKKSYTASIQTTKGTITAELYASDAPVTVNNFVFLAQKGYYDNVPFHRVIKGFMIQTGDPTGTGAGGPGYKFQDEPVSRPYEIGTLAMANAGRNTNGSQFFIVQGPSGTQLPPNYTIFGKVTDGMDVVNALANVKVAPSAMGETSRPVEDIRIVTVTIQEK